MNLLPLRPSLPLLIAVLALGPALSPLAVPLRAQSSPTQFQVCESSGTACNQPNARMDILWTFNGLDGTSSASADSRLTIETMDAATLIVRRTDASGLTALYTGQIRGSRINGVVQTTWPGHPGYPATGVFAATSQDFHDTAASVSPVGLNPPGPASSLPPELLVCENGVCNAAWTFRDGEGNGTWFDREILKSRLTVIRSAPDDLVIQRAPLGNGPSARYVGSLRGDHYAGTVIYSSRGHAGDASASWTASIPQTRCSPQLQLDAPQAKQIGQTALMFHHDQDAFNCYLVAAGAGDATAQEAVGLIFYQGRPGVPQNYAQAFVWLHKAADQGVYGAQRTVAEMYLAGQGTAPSNTLSGIYTRRADEQQHDRERREESAERAADRRAQIISSAVMGASFGMFLF